MENDFSIKEQIAASKKNEFYQRVELITKDLIRTSLLHRITGIDNIDPELINCELVDTWLTEVMALGFNSHNVEVASRDIYELQKPLMGVLIPAKYLEDYRASVFLTQNRFTEETFAFAKYVEMRDEATEEQIVAAVKEELDGIEAGDFMWS